MFERISLNQPPVLSLQNANAHDSVLRLDPLQKHPNADGTDYKKTTASARNIHIWSMKLLRNFFLGFVVFTFPFTIGVADDIVDLKAAYDLAQQNDPRFRIA